MRQAVTMAMMLAVGAIGTQAAAQESVKIDPALNAAQQKFQNSQKTCNVAEFNSVVTDDMLVLHADGRIEDKKAFGDFIAKCSMADIRLDVKTVRMYGDVAVITGELPFSIKNGPSMSFAATQVYVKRQGKWLFASHQSTDAKSFIASMTPPKK